MLAVDFLELLDGVSGVFLRVEKIETLIVEPVGRFVGRRIVLFGEHVEAAAGAEARRHHRDSKRAKRDQPKHRGCVVMSAVPWGTASLAAKVSNTDPLRERVASPASPVFQRRLCAPVYTKMQALAMRLSRHSARIKAKVKAKSPDFQDTSGP